MSTTLKKKEYKESQKVKDAFDNYNTYRDTQKPEDYVFSDDELLSRIQDELFNKEEFSYNPATDPLYAQYRESYTAAGKQAMEDSVGNASALSGGYGNSYAQTAGIKAYNSYLDKLNDVLPELYSAAYAKYNDDLDRLESKLGYLTDKNKEEYSRYLDRYNAYTDEVDALRKLYLSEYENDIAIQDSEWESAYKLAMKEQEREIANAQIGYKYYAANLAQQQFEQELAYKKAQAAQEQKYKNDQLRLEQFNARIENAERLAKAEKENREQLSQQDIYYMLGIDEDYEALSALDYNYEDDEYIRFKAIAMGIDKDLIDSYFAAKK